MISTHRLVTTSVFALAVLAAPSVRADELKPLALGAMKDIAAVKMKNVDGKPLSIADAGKEKGTLVVFTCNHCPYAKAWEGRIAELGNRALEKGIGVIAINPNDPGTKPEDGFEAMQERAKKLGLRFPYVVDATSDVARAFGATKTPEVYLFDKAGNLVFHGGVDDNADDPSKVTKRYLADAIDALLAGKAAPITEAKAIGCSIKFRKKG